MKKIIVTFIIGVILISNAHGQTSTPQSEATEVSQRMKDSLSLTEGQRVQIETATVEIQASKATLRENYNGRALELYLLMAEDNRDSVYKTLLPADKYVLFKQKKPTILGSN